MNDLGVVLILFGLGCFCGIVGVGCEERASVKNAQRTVALRMIAEKDTSDVYYYVAGDDTAAIMINGEIWLPGGSP